MSQIVLSSLLSIIGIFLSLAMLVASIIILIRTSSMAGIFMILGQSILLIMQVFWNLLFSYLINNLGISNSDSKYQMIMVGGNLIGLFGSALFVIGLFMLIFNNLREQK